LYQDRPIALLTLWKGQALAQDQDCLKLEDRWLLFRGCQYFIWLSFAIFSLPAFQNGEFFAPSKNGHICHCQHYEFLPMISMATAAVKYGTEEASFAWWRLKIVKG
jgi:hypothetical protein